MADIVKGDLFTHSAKYICHQCNCITQRSKHLAYDMFTKFPWANIYKERSDGHFDRAGTIIIRGNGTDQRYVVNMLAQFCPGKSKRGNDTQLHRLSWFQRCLDELIKVNDINNLESIAFPYMIGCGSAGGDWNKYKEKIDTFANTVKPTGVKVYIVQLISS